MSCRGENGRKDMGTGADVSEKSNSNAPHHLTSGDKQKLLTV